MINTIQSQPRYLVAKYAADVRRMELQNIGVVLWANGLVSARFLPDEDADFVDDHGNYRRWIDFWKDEIAQDSIAPIRGEPVSRSTPEFLDALRTTQEANYLLFDGGRLLEPISENEVDDAAEFLFSQIVARPRRAATEDAESESLAVIADRVIGLAGLRDRPDYVGRTTLHCPIIGVEQPITVSCCVGQGDHFSASDNVTLRGSRHAMLTAIGFQALVKAKKLRDKTKCGALVADTGDKKNRASIKLLRKVSTVINLSDERAAAEQIKQLVAA